MTPAPVTTRLMRAIAAIILCVVATVSSAQELAPRAFWPAPEGTNLIVAAYEVSSGDILTDPSLPVTGVDSTLHFFAAAYQRTFNAFDRTAQVQFSVPYTSGTTEGLVEGELRSRTLSAPGDASIRLAINLKGAPSMRPEAFRELTRNPVTIIGTSLQITAPTGGYDADKVLNAGANRWSVKTAFGAIWPLRPRLMLESEIGVRFFGENDEFVGTTREQDPIYSLQFHLVKIFDSGIWAALDANFYTGGRTTVDGVERGDLQRNSRFGIAALFPFKRGHAIRASLSTGVVTESGGDFTSLNLSYIYIWR